MNMSNEPRRTIAAPDVSVGSRPRVGILGLARQEVASKTAVETDPAPEGTLIVGEGIYVKGEIESCNTLVVDGKVEASLEAVVLTVRKGGLYNGRAAVKSASIDGQFDGDLTVDGLLTIESGGRVHGRLRYREVRIVQGGRLSGDIDLLPEAGSRKLESGVAKEAPEPRRMEGAVASR
jgi:cytoskeletal protein CcmA (bactofilin family)